jgi:hypothetical protein
MRAFIALASAVALAGCVYIEDNSGFDEEFTDDVGGGRAERLYAASVESGGLRVVAASNGCTTEDSFDVRVRPYRANGSPRFLVRLERETPDRCRAFMADGVELFFSRERLGLSQDAVIVVGNSVGR